MRRFQRLGAYAVVLDDDRLLLTRISARGFPPGWWALPGGGVDHGESPNDAVVRELHEETGLRATSVRLVEVHDVHVVDHGRDDEFEDYHGVHLVYAVEADTSVEPAVTEIDGTTEVAQWVPIDEVATLDLLPVVSHVLGHLENYRSQSAQSSSGSGSDNIR